MKWIKEDQVFYPIGDDAVIHLQPGLGVFKTYMSPNPADNRIGLTKIADSFKFPYKIYDVGIGDILDRIKLAWNSSTLSANNLGVIFNGIKGTGKTISAKLLCNEFPNLPVIIVDNPYDGLILDFIQSLTFECIILIDEAEKTFADYDDVLLKLIDGVYNASRKLYILTTNTLKINENLIGRPGRIRYIQQFGNLPAKTVLDYCKDNLKDQGRQNYVLGIVNQLEISTIDILRSIVDEVNIFNGVDTDIMNIPREDTKYEIELIVGLEDENIPALKKFLVDNGVVNLLSFFEGYGKYDTDREGCAVSMENLKELLPEVRYTDSYYVNSASKELDVDDVIRGWGKVLMKPDELGITKIKVEAGSGRENSSGNLVIVILNKLDKSLYGNCW